MTEMEILNTDQLAQTCKLTPKVIRSLYRKGIIKPIQAGARMLWHAESVRAALERASIPRGRLTK